jgi:hypothetical protein
MANSLTKPELMALNQAIVALIKSAVDKEVTRASSQFNKSDIVSFADNNNIRRHGVITKRNQKTFQVITPEHYSINVPATYLRHEPKPSPKLVKFKKDLLITNEDRAEALDDFIKELRNKNPSS